jgi:hypothetical protein
VINVDFMTTRNFIETSPHHLSALCVVRADLSIGETISDPQQWLFVIVDLHRALNCALVAALRGTAGIGAFSPKLRREWLNFFEESRVRKILPPNNERVESFPELLRRAQEASPDLMGAPLVLSAQEKSDLSKLNSLRDDIEHVKMTDWFLELAGLPRICRSAARTLNHLFSLPPVFMHLGEPELNAANDAINRIMELKDR